MDVSRLKRSPSFSSASETLRKRCKREDWSQVVPSQSFKPERRVRVAAALAQQGHEIRVLKSMNCGRVFTQQLTCDLHFNAEVCALLLPISLYADRGGKYLRKRLHMCKQAGYTQRVVMLYRHTDALDSHLNSLSMLCMEHGATLLIGTSSEQCARFLETFKVWEKKGTASLEGQLDNSPEAAFTTALGVIKGVNKNVVVELARRYKTIAGLAEAATVEELLTIKGVGKTTAMAIMGALEDKMASI